ncbi:NAD(P)-dependent oxidoreductase [Dactylosporangium sp. NPDC048998]|uniref:NAD(P)-dependent oxidoreductase n=1 Tax=Dactylosporangium sp. NPDC048998 TaxID=3363976 RepID=UPI00371D5E11
MDIAVLGMGNMGRALAARLLQGEHRVRVWNRTRGRAADVVATGAQEVATVADAVLGADAAITMLANDDAVRSVALGPLREALEEQAVYMDCSTVSPSLSAELAAAFPGRYLAVPILGNPVAVRAGQAILLAGGDRVLVDRLRPVLAALSPAVRRYDNASLAGAAKLASNLLLLSEVVALAESVAVGRAGGLSDEQLRDLLGDSPLVEGVRNRFEDVLTGARDTWWSNALGAKDARLAVELARGANVELPDADTVYRRYEAASAAGLADADIAAVAELYRRPAAPVG